MADHEEEGGRVARALQDVFSGAGLGLLLGTLLGLSISPVVGVVVGGLTSLLAVFLGLESRSGEGALGGVRLNGVRIGSFGFATLGGVLLGLFLRVTDPFAGPLPDHLDRWKQVVPETVAQQLVVFERTGLAPAKLAFDGGAVEVSENAAAVQPRRAGLYSALAEEDLCSDLAPDRYRDQVDELLRVYDRHADDAVLARVAEEVRALPAAGRLDALRIAHVTLCAVQRSQPQ